MIGKTLGHYEITGLVGKGGMGEVYRASDTKLGREVAIKILPSDLSSDPERVARFEREARTLASLQHPNVATIYGFEESDGVRFLAMELVEGEDLSQVLSRGRVSVDEVLRIGRQMATGIEAAHDKNVVHRDLKPANVKVEPGGAVKILDFGLARAYAEDPSGGEDLENSPTITAAMTRPGVVLGTAAYMSPEQARGKPVDKRTDIWAFGCLLYEMLTGVSAFRGETVTDTLASIVKTPADFGKLPADTPQRVRDLLQRCLEKDARNRLRDIGEARIELQRALDASDAVSVASVSDEAPATKRARLPSPLWLAVAVLIGAGVGIALWNAMRPGASDTSAVGNQVVRFSIAFPENLEVRNWGLSPDGGTLMYRARPKQRTAADEDPEYHIYLRPLDSFETRVVANSEGANRYTFSPDGRWLVINAPIAPRSTKYRLWKVRVGDESPPLALMDWRDDWTGALLWLPDGDIVVSTTGRKSVVRIPSGGGEPSDPVELKYAGFDGEFRLPFDSRAVLPDGVHVLGDVPTYSERGWETNVGLLNLATGDVRLLIENGSNAVFSTTGHLVFARGDALLATEFNLDRLERVGNTVAIQSGFRAVAGYGDTEYALSDNGTKIQWPGGVYGDKRQLVFVEHSKANGFQITEPWSDDLRFFDSRLTVSRNGRRLAATIASNVGLYETWISDMDRPRLIRFVHEPGRDCTPVLWTPDGESLIYQSLTTEETSLRVRRVDGSDPPRVLITHPKNERYFANDFLDGGATLIATHWTDRADTLVLIPLEEGSPPTPKVWLANANWGQISQDGRWMAYLSDASGQTELYLRPLRPDGSLGREIPVSTNGAGAAWWIDNTSPPVLSYHRADEIYSVEVHDDGRVGTPQLMGNAADIYAKIRQHTHLADGRWLAVLEGEGEATPDRVNVVLNWTEELKRRMASQ